MTPTWFTHPADQDPPWRPCYWRDGWPQRTCVRWAGRGMAVELGNRVMAALFLRDTTEEDRL